MSLERKLLIVVLNTNPIWWGLQNSGLIPNAQTNPKIPLQDNLKEYLYPSKPKKVEKNSSPWDKYEQISDMYEIIRDNLKKLLNEQLSILNSG
ncbi:unnamed protein product [Brachionus calyciflorus]|uniref:Uncharacterized protein n=1 Tax=Brachionus calyciflorus TaxID=104777 RepID=A0A814A0B7_9BILA|nr:unnamed protein product [Brachionus calyciflorus]